MKLQINLTLALLLALTLVSAVTVYSGESIELELAEPFEYYSIAGNTTEVDLEVVQNGNNVTITPNKYMKTDSFEIIFFNAEKETITVHTSSGGGGGGGTRTIYKDKIVEVDNYIDREIEVEIEVEGETTEVETLVEKINWWGISILIAVIIILLIIVIKKNRSYDSDYTDERGLEKDE